jgi:hypothetical protein
LSDAQSEATHALIERLRNPFIFAFLASWLVTNWTFFAHLLMGSEEIGQRIELAKAELTQQSAITVPLAIAFIYTFVWPWATFLIMSYHAFIRRKSDEASIINEHELAILKTKNNYQRMRLETNEQRITEQVIKSRKSLHELMAFNDDYLKTADALIAKAETAAKKLQNYRFVFEDETEILQHQLEDVAEEGTEK